MKDTFFSSNLKLNIKGILSEFSHPLIMGILNTTPDSFYAGSRVSAKDDILGKAEQMIQDGADILDIGGYSSRPGAGEVSEAEEIERTEAAIKAIKSSYPEVLISIDTFRANVAEKAILAGADIINDISGGQLDPRIYSIAAKHNCPYILMHMRGGVTEMMNNTNYDNLIQDLSYYFSERIEMAQSAGVKDLIIDPGFGFSKTLEQNYQLLSQIDLLHLLEKPLLIGVSRKSMIYKTLENTPEESLNGTTVLNTIALEKGAKILRVHDVKPAKEAVILMEKLKTCSPRKREN